LSQVSFSARISLNDLVLNIIFGEFKNMENRNLKRYSEFRKYNIPQNKTSNKFKKVFFIFLAVFVIWTAFSYKSIISQETFIGGLGQLPVVKQIRQIVTSDGKLTGERQDRINFLLLGQGGPGHDGPYLTDTIIFGSIKPTTGQIVLLSIPRDLLVEVPGHGWHKINSLNAFGESDDYEGGGSAFVADVVSDLFDQEIHYWFRIDFSAFEKLINELGEVEVCVDNTFVDNLYPTSDYKYQTVSFESGCQTMGGELALKYSRSRHGNNGEGSDFARSKRQQKLILAIKDKIFDWRNVFNINLIYSIFDITKNNIQTNIEKKEIVNFIDLARDVVDNEIKRRSLDNSPQGLLRANITEQGAYILEPRVGNWSEIKNLIENIFLISETNENSQEEINLVVLNGTEISGLASEKAGFFTSLSYDIKYTGNAPRQDYQKTVIYNLSENDNYKEPLKIMKKYLDANVTDNFPGFLQAELDNQETEDIDFLVVLGCDQDPERCEEERIKKENQTSTDEMIFDEN
jgi:polyisoprenyl-teichoic acid--peptidoglycan teichoic acid transferase